MCYLVCHALALGSRFVGDDYRSDNHYACLKLVDVGYDVGIYPLDVIVVLFQ